MQERTSETRDYYPLGDELVHWIDGSDDFPLDKAHKVNSRRWTKPKGRRYEKFTEEAELDWAKSFFNNPWQRVEGPLLEVGCAGGHNLEYCAQQGIEALSGIDISDMFIQKARDRVPQASIQKADFLELPYESGSFNSIIARGSLHITTTKGLLAALREAHRVLRDGGLIYMHRRFRPSLLESDKAKRVSLFTYVVYRKSLQTNPRQKLWMVRNFVPERQLTSMIRSVGFLPLGDPPATLFTTTDKKTGDVRYSLSYVCTKRPSRAH